MSTNAKKRRRDECNQPSVARLQELMDLSYDRTIIDNLISQHVKSVAEEDSTPEEAAAPAAPATKKLELHCCPRAYEESFLREPIGTERRCARGQNCEGLQLNADDCFILREFVYPNTDAQDSRALCLLCRRLEISYAFFKYETGHSLAPSVHASEHYNLVGLPGEYDIRDCIVSSSSCSGLPLPVVLHSRTAYTVYNKDGVKHLAQSRMRCPGSSDEHESGPFLMRRAALCSSSKVAPSKPLACSM